MTLPLNCQVDYYEDFLSAQEATELYRHLQQDLGIKSSTPVFHGEEVHELSSGKLMILDEQLYTTNQFPTAIWGETAVWTDQLSPLKAKVERLAARTFQTCVCIYYPDGTSGVDYHSDFSAFGDTTIIPSLTLGEEREFRLRELSTGIETCLTLKHGSLLIMGKHCQERYEHSLPVNPKYKNGRINLTFRQYGF